MGQVRTGMVTRAICRSFNEYADECVAVRQLDGAVACPCGKWPKYEKAAEAAIADADEYSED